MLKEDSDENLLSKIIEYFSYVPHHPDLWGDLNYSSETKKYAKKLIQTIDTKTIIKMLNLTEDGIERGTIGQCVESLISIIPNNENILIEIINEYYENHIGINAFLILSSYNPKYIYAQRGFFKNILGEIAALTVEFIEEFGGYDLYT